MAGADQINALLTQLRDELTQSFQNELAARDARLQEVAQQNQTLLAERQEMLASLRDLPENLKNAMKEGSQQAVDRGLIDTKGLGKPYVFTDEDAKFRHWAIKVEDFIIGKYGDEFRQVLEWAIDFEGNMTYQDLSDAFGDNADYSDQIEEIQEKNSQIFILLRNLTEQESFDIIDGVDHGFGLKAWQKLHLRWDPTTGGRRMTMLATLMNPGRVKLEELASAIQRWKTLRRRYSNKKDSDGKRHNLPDDISRASLMKLVPEDLAQHLLLNHRKLTTFETMEEEVALIVEQKTGYKMKDSLRDTGPRPMDIGAMDLAALMTAVSKGKGKFSGSKGKGGKDGKGCFNCGIPGHTKAECRKPGGGAHKGGKGDSNKGKTKLNLSGAYSGKGNPSSSSSIVCWKCGKTGHKADQCWSGGKGGKPDKGKGKGKGKSLGSFDEGNETPVEPEAEEAGFHCLDLCPLSAEGDLASTTSWIKCNFDTGAAETALPAKEFDLAKLKESGKFWKTASGEKTPDYGTGKLRGHDEGGIFRGLNGRVIGVHKVLVSACRVHEKENFSLLEAGGGYIVPKNSNVGRAVMKAMKEAIAWYGEGGLIPVHEEQGVYNFYLQAPARHIPSNAEASSSEGERGSSDFTGLAKKR